MTDPMHYLVWRKNGGRKPRFKHDTLESARVEAHRLANESGAKILVLAVLEEVDPQQKSEGGAA